MRTFTFGDVKLRDDKSYYFIDTGMEIEALNINNAIAKFIMSVSSYDKYYSKDSYALDENGRKIEKIPYDAYNRRTIYETIDNPFINIHVLKETLLKQPSQYSDRNREKFTACFERKLYYSDIKEFKVSSITKGTKSFLALPGTVEEDNKVSKNKLVKSDGSKRCVKFLNRTIDTNNMDEVLQAEKDLEYLRRDLAEKMMEMEERRKMMEIEISKLRSEFKKKLKALNLLELFMGVDENIKVLKQGEKAPDKVKLSLYQQVLYMDEEMSIYDGHWKFGGIDDSNLNEFDTWITEHYEDFLYEEKAMCVFKPRRKPKNYTDEWKAYKGLGKDKKYFHAFIEHQKKEFVRGKVHTNTIEGFWSLFSRSLMGIYHYMSKKHIDRYLNALAFRYNNMEGTNNSMFQLVILNSSGKLSYEKLTGRKQSERKETA